MYETEIHRIYSEGTSPVLAGPVIFLCSPENKFNDDEVEEIIGVIFDEGVTCPLCLQKIDSTSQNNVY